MDRRGCKHSDFTGRVVLTYFTCMVLSIYLDFRVNVSSLDGDVFPKFRSLAQLSRRSYLGSLFLRTHARVSDQ